MRVPRTGLGGGRDVVSVDPSSPVLDRAASDEVRRAIEVVTRSVAKAHVEYNEAHRDAALVQSARALRVGADWRDDGVLERVVEVFSRYGALQGRLPLKRELFERARVGLEGARVSAVAAALVSQPLQVWWVERSVAADRARRFRPLLGPESSQSDWLHGLFTDAPVPLRDSGALWGVRLRWDERSYLVVWAEVPGSLLALLREEAVRWQRVNHSGDFAQEFETALARRVADPYAELPLWSRASWYRAMRPTREALNQRVVNALQRRLGLPGILELRAALAALSTPGAIADIWTAIQASAEDVLLEFAEHDGLEVLPAQAVQELGWSRERAQEHLELLRRSPVSLLDLDGDLLPVLGVGREESISAALLAARAAPEGVRGQVEGVYSRFVAEQRWVDMSGLAYDAKEVAPVGPFYTRLDYLHEMRAVMDPAFWALPLSHTELGPRELKRLARALGGVGAAGGEPLMGDLPRRQVEMLRLKNVGPSTLEGFRAAMLQTARQWRWKRASLEAGVPGRAVLAGDNRQAAQGAHEGLEDLLALFAED